MWLATKLKSEYNVGKLMSKVATQFHGRLGSL